MTEPNHWQLIPASDYESPTPPAVMRLQMQWRRLLRTLGAIKAENLAVSDTADELAPPDFASPQAQTALTEYLTQAMSEPSSVCFLLDPPFSGTAAMACTWGWQQGRRILVPPTATEIEQAAVDDWWQRQPQQNLKSDQAWLIDDLTQYFLRTSTGLRFIRAWLPRVLAGEFGGGVIVCDSWAFAFLRRDWPHNLPSSHSLAPATPSLLRQLGIEAEEHQLERLTGEARGNLGIAWAVWRRKYLQQQALPTLPVTANDYTGFILYALLLHRGLSWRQLIEVLSNVPIEALKMQLLSLAQRGIIEGDANLWQLTAQAYLTVRDFLGSRDYLLDDF